MADFGIGDPGDTKATSGTGRWSLISLLKGILDALSGGGGSLQVEGTQADAEAVTANPVLMGYRNSSGEIATWNDDADSGAPGVVILGGDVRISGVIRASASIDVLQADVTTSSARIMNTLANCTAVTIRNHDAANPVYIRATAGVTAANGYIIPAGQVHTIAADPFTTLANLELYGIATGATVRVSIQRQYYS